MTAGADFLGIGWAFPPRFAAGGAEVAMATGNDDIEQSLAILLATRRGERVLQDDFGCELGDFLFGEYNRMGRTFTASAVGPVAGLADTAFDLFSRARRGDDLAGAALNAALQNTPFMNLFYVRPVLDYLIIYRLQEAINPGYLRRMERRVERENGQSFILPPSQIVR